MSDSTMESRSESLIELVARAIRKFCENPDHKTLEPDEAFATRENPRVSNISFDHECGRGEIVVTVLDGNVQVHGTMHHKGDLGPKVITDRKGALVFGHNVRTIGVKDLESVAEQEIYRKLRRTWRNAEPKNSRKVWVGPPAKKAA